MGLSDDIKEIPSAYNPEDHLYRRLIGAYLQYDVADFKAGRPNELDSALVWMTKYAPIIIDSKGGNFIFDDLYNAYTSHCFLELRAYRDPKKGFFQEDGP